LSAPSQQCCLEVLKPKSETSFRMGLAGSTESKMDTSILDEVVEQLRGMPLLLQKQVLIFAKTLTDSTVQGVPGSRLVRFAGTISPDDIALMREAIEQDCEQVDANEW